jgi:hypothetical protein
MSLGNRIALTVAIIIIILISLYIVGQFLIIEDVDLT